MSLAFAFDFDGVILDSLPALKKTYFDFLATYDRVGSDQEFAILNGPSLPEIISRLKQKYNLPRSNSELLQVYKECLGKDYYQSSLVAGVSECLVGLKSRGIFLALVTSSLREEVIEVLEKHAILNLFDIILSGDSVIQSKPFPDIYLKLKEKFPHLSFWAIEDSKNGLVSAKLAGLRTVFFDSDGTGIDIEVDCRVRSLSSLLTRVIELDSFCCVIESAEDIEILVDKSYFPNLTIKKKRYVDYLWHDAHNKTGRRDGDMLFYHSHFTLENRTIIRAFWGPYRFFFARQIDQSIDIPFVPLAVSGVCVNIDDQLLIGRRKNVTEYFGYLEFAPSGGISRLGARGATLDYKNQLMDEFLEETGLSEEIVSLVKPLGLIKDFKNQVIDICCLIETKVSSRTVLKNTLEYQDLSWIHQSEVDTEVLVPTSVALLNLFNDHKTTAL